LHAAAHVAVRKKILPLVHRKQKKQMPALRDEMQLDVENNGEQVGQVCRSGVFPTDA